MKQHNWTLVPLICLLSACGGTPTGNSSFVEIKDSDSIADALPRATKHCSQFGKVPQFQQKLDRTTHMFNCVNP